MSILKGLMALYEFEWLFKVLTVNSQQCRDNTKVYTVKPVYSGHLGTYLKCPDYQGVLIFLHVNGYFGTINECPDYGSVPIFKGPD